MGEMWLYNPWVIAIGSGIFLILFEEIISAYKEKIHHRPRRPQANGFYKTKLLLA